MGVALKSKSQKQDIGNVSSHKENFGSQRIYQEVLPNILETNIFKCYTNSPRPRKSANCPQIISLSFFVFQSFEGRTALSAYGGSQARGLIGAVAAGLRQSHSHSESELHLRTTPQLMVTLDL